MLHPPEQNKKDIHYEFQKNGTFIMAVLRTDEKIEVVIMGIHDEQFPRYPTLTEMYFIRNQFWDKEDYVFLALDENLQENNMQAVRLVSMK